MHNFPCLTLRESALCLLFPISANITTRFPGAQTRSLKSSMAPCLSNIGNSNYWLKTFNGCLLILGLTHILICSTWSYMIQTLLTLSTQINHLPHFFHPGYITTLFFGLSFAITLPSQNLCTCTPSPTSLSEACFSP